jgi:hypothetical protein
MPPLVLCGGVRLLLVAPDFSAMIGNMRFRLLRDRRER